MVFWPTSGLISTPHALQGSLSRDVGREPGELGSPIVHLPRRGSFFKILDARSWQTRSAPCGVVALISCETPAPSIHGQTKSSHQPKCGTLRMSASMRQVLWRPPTHDTVDRKSESVRASLSTSRRTRALVASTCLSLSLAGLPVKRLAVNQTIRQKEYSLALKRRRTVTDHLEPDSTDPRRLRATATIVNLRIGARSRRLCPASFDALANRRSAASASKSSGVRNATLFSAHGGQLLRISSPH